uniref:Ig-like domain-containing protein n=1 Tax=Astatotilapia calliptera TaxID=8154 RepID=A0A3P8PCK4_ASTCA
MATLRITSLFGGVLCACVLACTAEGELSGSSHTRDKKVPAESGNNVTLTCRAPNNKFIVVNWSRADLGEEYVLLYRDEHFDTTKQHPSFKKRVALQDRHMKDGDVSLILENVTTADAGTYECRVFMEETRSWESICTSHLFLTSSSCGLTSTFTVNIFPLLSMRLTNRSRKYSAEPNFKQLLLNPASVRMNCSVQHKLHVGNISRSLL